MDQRTRGLSPRQREVLDLLGKGLTNRQIAERLGVSESTVKAHVSVALDRLGVQSRARAAAILNDKAGDRAGITTEVGGTELTERQAEILHLVADGFTNRQVAHRLSVSDKTVKAELSKIYWRLGAANRVHAAAILSRTHRSSPSERRRRS